MREAVAEEARAHVEDENDFAMPVSESTPAVTRERRRGRRLRSHRSHRVARVRGGRRTGGAPLALVRFKRGLEIA